MPAQAQQRAAAAGPDYEAAMKHLRFRSIGPAIMGGRVDDFAVVESDPSIVYVAMASGGVWKTTNGGTTWTPVFDEQPVSTIGDVTVAPSDPSIVWVGTGEPNNRQSSSWGNGVYKSTDAGKTWQHMGLAETHHIGRIVIHPTNPDVLYVAAVGRLWGPSRERGVYKTTDGGRTWTNVLYINEDTGVVDIAMDQQSPGTLLAAAYQRRRTVFGFNGSGPHGGIYRTTDGGATWKKIEKGLPWDPNFRDTRTRQQAGGGGGPQSAQPAQQAQAAAAQEEEPKGPQEIGRIGLNFYRKDTNIVYALVEHRNGGTFRSDDKGETWTKMSDTNPRPMYYSKIHIDPQNDQRVWVLGAQMFYSEDGGKTFRTDLVGRIHGDYHAMWINPANSAHMIVGSDGGIHWSWDRGRTWEFIDDIPLGQFYEVGVNMDTPYLVCGGLQDNNTWCGPSETLYSDGIPNGEWFTIGGGDGFYAQFDPYDKNIVYAESQDGNLLRRHLVHKESKSIRPQPPEGAPRYRFQWNSPIVPSKHTAGTLYYAGNFVFKSTDRGDTWTKISEDLTSGEERDKKEIMGKVPDRTTLSRHDGVQQWPTITTLVESPRNADILWAGTDDGNLHVTRDGGKTWKSVFAKVPGVPKGTYVSRVIASHHADGTAYATFDGHRMNDFGIYVYATSDFGETWKAIRNGIPENKGVVNVIREHHRNPDLLFVGTEYGAYVSFDRGANWTRIRMGLPMVPVDDIAIHPRENDLILGTHGRSIWILDDITALEQMNAQVAGAELHAFATRPAIQWRKTGRTTSASRGHKVFFGENPPEGAILQYYLKQGVDEAEEEESAQEPAQQTQRDAEAGEQGPRVRITISDAGGKRVRQLDGPARTGINRVVWNFRADSPVPRQMLAGISGGGFFGRFLATQLRRGGASVDPGTYTVKLSYEGKEATTTVVVNEDPRIQISPEDRAARRKALDEIAALARPAFLGQRTVQALRTALDGAMQGWKRPGAAAVPDNVKKAAEELLKKVDEVYPKFATPPQQQQLGAAGPPLVFTPPPLPNRILQLGMAIEGWTAAPAAPQLEELKLLSDQLREAGATVRKLMQEDLPALNKLMNEAGVPHIHVPSPRERGDAGATER
jgi:photosystem II stability/assembly factor-like uncharacterized protein